MVSKLTQKLKKLKQDNQGAAIVVAIVAIAFIGMLIAMLTYMAYYNYLMKNVDKQSKDNFYSAEYALEIINAGLQKDISDSMAEAYVKATKTTVEEDSAEAAERVNSIFRSNYITGLQSRLQVTAPAPNPDKYDTQHLRDMWNRAALPVATTPGEEGAYLDSTDNKLAVAANGDYMTLYNLRVVYTDERGYVSIIETDIRLKVPSMDFAQSTGNLNVEEFSLIANVSIVNDPLNQDEVPGFTLDGALVKGDVDTEISGNIYGGKDGVYVGNAAGIKLIRDQRDTDNGLDDLRYKLIANSINVNNTLSNGRGMELNEKYNTYVSDINIASGQFKGDGNMIVGDDMDIAGKSSTVTLKGTYLGYGNESTSAKASSSILINGSKTKLNFSGLQSLTLSGHAYVGAKRYDADKDRLKMVGIKEAAAANPDENFKDYTADQIAAMMERATDPTSDKIDMDMEEYADMLNSTQYITWVGNTSNRAQAFGETYDPTPRNESDIMTGESISVKANQLLYLVPSDCIGYIRNSNVQKYARNPMTYDEYKYLCNDFDYDEFIKRNADNVCKYPQYASMLTEYRITHPNAENVPLEEIDPDKVPIELHTYEPIRLSVLWDRMESQAYTATAKPVYRRVNGTVMVYLYLDFASDEITANQFYKAYYAYDPESVNMYVNSYIDSVTWPNRLSAGSNNLTLGGNAFRMNGRNVVLIEDSMENSAKYSEMMKAQETQSAIYETLMHILKEESKLMTSTQSVTDVFDNIVDAPSLNRISALGGGANGLLFDDSYDDEEGNHHDATMCAYVGKQNVVYPSGTCPENTNVIITSGDVYLRADYDGLVMAGGKIYICSGCNQITYNPDRVLNALRLTYNDFGTDVYVYEVFGISGELTYGTGESTGSGDSISVSDLISYQNWKKE